MSALQISIGTHFAQPDRQTNHREEIVVNRNLAVLLLLSYVISVQAQGPSNTNTLYQNAIEQHRNRRNQEALSSLTEAVRLNPGFAEGYNSLCVLYYELNRLAEAEAACRHALTLSPRSDATLYNLGIIYGDDRTDEALAALQKSIRLNPKLAPAHYTLATMYLRVGRYDAAVESLQRVLDLTPHDTAAWNELGVIYCQLKRYDEAVRAFRQALNCRPNDPRSQANLATAYYLCGHYAEALELLEQSVNQDPESAVSQNNLGQTYLKLSRYREAIEHIERARGLAHVHKELPDADLSNNLGFAYAQLKRYPEALKCFAEAVALRPDFAVAIFNSGVVRLMMNDHDGAVAEYATLKTLNRELAGKLFARIYQGQVITASSEH